MWMQINWQTNFVQSAVLKHMLSNVTQVEGRKLDNSLG